MSLEPGPDETLDVLSRTLRIIQRKRGHRATSDDVILAGIASAQTTTPKRILDLGSGKGTVALLLLRRFPDATAVGIEAFPESHALAIRNAALNQLEARYTPRMGDLRDPLPLADMASFDLITGAPPFMPLGSGVLPQDPQRAAGRFELKGGIEGYAHTAAAACGPKGRVVLLMDGRSAGRTENAFAAAGLALHHRIAVHPRPGRPPVYWVFVGGHVSEPGCTTHWAMRGSAGDAWSAEYGALRARLDLP